MGLEVIQEEHIGIASANKVHTQDTPMIVIE